MTAEPAGASKRSDVSAARGRLQERHESSLEHPMWAAAGVEIDVPGGFAGPVGGGGSAAPADAANPPTAPFVPTQRLHFETSAGKTVPLAYMRPPPRFHDVDGPLVVHPPMLDLDTLCQLTASLTDSLTDSQERRNPSAWLFFGCEDLGPSH